MGEGPAQLLPAFLGADFQFDVIVGLDFVEVELEGVLTFDFLHVGLFQGIDQGAAHGCPRGGGGKKAGMMRSGPGVGNR